MKEGNTQRKKKGKEERKEGRKEERKETCQGYTTEYRQRKIKIAETMKKSHNKITGKVNRLKTRRKKERQKRRIV